MADRICNCGTCNDAAAAALRTFEQMTEQNCPVWAAQVGVALGVLAVQGIHVMCENLDRPIRADTTISKIHSAMLAALAHEVKEISK